VIRNLYALPTECYKRGDFEVDLQIQGVGGWEKKDIATMVNDTVSASQYVVFFTGEDCNPDSVIDNACSDDGCSTLLPNNPSDYQSWSVWDTCLGKPGCSLEQISRDIWVFSKGTYGETSVTKPSFRMAL
jgi:hypothetical protein